MTPLHAIVFTLIFQVTAYALLDTYNLRGWKYAIVGMILIFNFFVLPGCFITGNPTKEPRCGMPALGITLAIWILGGGSILMTHLIYSIAANYNRKKDLEE